MSEGATVYLIHFSRPHKHARHYLGSADVLSVRLEQHRAGSGARLMAVITEQGIDWVVARTWPNGGRRLEQKLKKRRNSVRLCPLCNPGAERLGRS